MKRYHDLFTFSLDSINQSRRTRRVVCGFGKLLCAIAPSCSYSLRWLPAHQGRSTEAQGVEKCAQDAAEATRRVCDCMTIAPSQSRRAIDPHYDCISSAIPCQPATIMHTSERIRDFFGCGRSCTTPTPSTRIDTTGGFLKTPRSQV